MDVKSIRANLLRKNDTVVRLGGDEFAFLLPETDQDAAISVISRVQMSLLEEMEKKDWPVTFSIGAMTFRFPSPMVKMAIPAASSTPLLGFLVAPSPLAKGRRKGKIRSDARDCKILGAPKKDAMADESVAAMTPADIRKPKIATRFMAV